MTARYGTLWIVKKDMLADHDYDKEVGKRKIVIAKGEIIEWRYESNNHFRTMDNRWFFVDDKTFDEHCLLIGKIWEKVCFQNRAETEEIFKLDLFDWSENGRELYQRIKEELEVNEQKGDDE